MAVERGKTFSKPPSEQPNQVNQHPQSHGQAAGTAPRHRPWAWDWRRSFSVRRGMIGRVKGGIFKDFLFGMGLCVRYLCKQIVVGYHSTVVLVVVLVLLGYVILETFT